MKLKDLTDVSKKTEVILGCRAELRKLFYVESGFTCGIRIGLSEKEVYCAELKCVGMHRGVREVREATEEDIDYVKSVGGYIPEFENIIK